MFEIHKIITDNTKLSYSLYKMLIHAYADECCFLFDVIFLLLLLCILVIVFSFWKVLKFNIKMGFIYFFQMNLIFPFLLVVYCVVQKEGKKLSWLCSFSIIDLVKCEKGGRTEHRFFIGISWLYSVKLTFKDHFNHI